MATIPWLIALVLAVGGFAAPKIAQSLFQISDTSLTGAFGGALVGAAAALVGALIERWRSEKLAREKDTERRARIKALVTAELVNVATGFIGAKRLIDSFIAQAKVGGSTLTSIDLESHVPRPMPFTDSLGVELLELDQKELDVLVTLKANIAITAESMKDASQGHFGFLRGESLRAGLLFTAEILAQAFEEFAPERKLALQGSEPRFASEILRNL